ncbi:hypothetical protein GCM10010191_04600 [Actinomadura vinacea]|uniref:Sec-independent protein translocase protein TatA n=1 Tax=Actinomadura vinacea TaxID=115336 RepID=A0ABN3ICA3_9ACTN
MANFATTEILIVLLVIMLLFGSTKLPQLARSLGRSVRILKAETKGLHDDEPLEDPPHASRPDRRRDQAPQLREEATDPERQATAHHPTPQEPLPKPGRFNADRVAWQGAHLAPFAGQGAGGTRHRARLLGDDGAHRWLPSASPAR